MQKLFKKKAEISKEEKRKYRIIILWNWQARKAKAW